MKAVVTGAAGFIGTNLTRALLDGGHDVVGIDVLSDYYDVELKRSNLASSASARFSWIHGDLASMDLGPALADAEVVFHLAGQPGVRGSWGESFAEYTHANVTGTQRLLEAALRVSGLRRLIYASSSSVYGDVDSFPSTETDLPRPHSPYGVTKLAGEHLVGLYRANFALPTTSFRFFSVYGPLQRPDMAFSRFFRAVAAGRKIPVFGDGEQIRDFTFVGDIVAALVTAATVDREMPPVMNLAGGSRVSVNETLSLIGEIAGTTPTIEYLPPVRGDVRQTGGSSRLAMDSLGWSPRVSLDAGLRRQFEWSASTAGLIPDAGGERAVRQV